MTLNLRALRRLLFVPLLLVAVVACGSDDSGSSTGGTSGGGGGTGATDGGDGEPSEPYTFRIPDQGAIANNLPILVAMDQGIMEEHNVEVESVSMRLTPDVLAALANDDVDAIVHTPTNLTIMTRDSATEVQYFTHIQDFDAYLVGRAGLEIPLAADVGWEETFRALEGHSIGGLQAGGQFDYMVRAMLEQVGLDADQDLDIIQTGAGTEALASLKAGQVDVVVVPDPLVAVSLEAEDAGGVLMNFGTEGPEEMVGTVQVGALAKKERIEAEPEAFAALRAAIQDGIDFINDPANADAVAESIAKWRELDPELAGRIAPGLKTFTYEIDEAKWDKTNVLFTDIVPIITVEPLSFAEAYSLGQ